jgi:2-keto-4-pentenoate hydratase/2-oxohepta-3-ene-1,7-dioic acid hydratase in catechol pathway
MLDGDLIVDLAASAPAAQPMPSLQALIEAGAPALTVVRDLERWALEGHLPGSVHALSGITLLAPIPRPLKNVFCVGKNYRDHVAEISRAGGTGPDGIPEFPVFFSKPPTSVIGPDAEFRLDEGVSRRLDYEVELGVVIGLGGRDIPAERAFDHIFGYTIVNDITARDLQKRHVQWLKGKGLDGSCPIGPWIVHKSALPDPQNLEISLSVNGEIRQNSNTSQMIFAIPEIIAQLSRGMTLEPGDIIATGTPEGVGMGMQPPQFLKAGDLVECHIPAIGRLATPIEAA